MTFSESWLRRMQGRATFHRLFSAPSGSQAWRLLAPFHPDDAPCMSSPPLTKISKSLSPWIVSTSAAEIGKVLASYSRRICLVRGVSGSAYGFLEKVSETRHGVIYTPSLNVARARRIYREDTDPKRLGNSRHWPAI